MKLRALLYIFSFFFFTNLYAQPIRINRIRVGIDPVRSASMLMKEKDFYNNRFFFNTWEVNAEIIGPYRTSLLAEFGFTKAHLQPLRGTLDYRSSGYYWKTGLDFNLTEEDSKYEFDIGWRLGFSSYQDQASINLQGTYWGDTLHQIYKPTHKTASWGELILTQKVRLFYNNQNLNDLYCGVSVRMRFMNDLTSSDGIHSLMIPGYGPAGSFSPGITFMLCYQFNIKRSVIKELIHKHSNEFITR